MNRQTLSYPCGGRSFSQSHAEEALESPRLHQVGAPGRKRADAFARWESTPPNSHASMKGQTSPVLLFMSNNACPDGGAKSCSATESVFMATGCCRPSFLLPIRLLCSDPLLRAANGHYSHPFMRSFSCLPCLWLRIIVVSAMVLGLQVALDLAKNEFSTACAAVPQ